MWVGVVGGCVVFVRCFVCVACWCAGASQPATPLRTHTTPPPHTHATFLTKQELLFGAGEAPVAVSTLSDPTKPVLFSMARLDRVKNLTGLVEW